jgi:hypothetical protein
MTNRRRFMKLVSTAAVASMAATQTDSTPRSSAEIARTVSRANKTVLGKNVYVFDAAMSAAGIHQIARDIFRKMESNQFASQGYALLFKPGKYRLNFNVGFYTEVAGLGQNPDDVLIDGGVNVNAQWSGGAALDNFWRTISNFALVPSASGGAARFAVSQASPMRRMHVKGNLNLFDVWKSCHCGAGYASGGFLADTLVDGKVVPASQQQWLSRNSRWELWSNAVWNMVFVGCQNTPGNTFPNPAYTVVNRTPVIREKPYLYVDRSGDFAVFVPAIRRNSNGVSWASGSTPGESIPIEQFYIAQCGKDSASSLNRALADGKNIIFTPGTYQLNDTLRVMRPDAILLGLGVPSLTAMTGRSAISVADVGGVKIAGLIIDAGPVNSRCLLEMGPTRSSADHAANPSFLYDLTVRTAGPAGGRNETGIIINSNHVVMDNVWIWRADHGSGVGWTKNPTKHGLVVNGEGVTCYGLFNEHHEQYQTLWNGNAGRVYMYQSEMPYDPPDQASWMAGRTDGYASYKVADTVTRHEAWGLGVYCYFRDAVIQCESAIEAPVARGVKLHHLTTVWLNGRKGSRIDHIVNRIGNPVYANTPPSAMRQMLKEFGGLG